MQDWQNPFAETIDQAKKYAASSTLGEVGFLSASLAYTVLSRPCPRQ
jgi:hypothetical protein